MFILQVASGDFFSTYGGGQVYVKNIVDEMIRQGYSLTVISFVNQNSGIEKKQYKSIDLYEVGNCGIDKLQNLVKQLHPDVIHAHSHKAHVVTIGNNLHIPVIVTAHHGGILCPAGTLLNSKDEICHTAVSHEHCLSCCLRGIRSGRYWYPMMRLIPRNLYRKLGVGLSRLPFIPFVSPIGGAAWSILRKQQEWETIAEGCSRMIAPCNAIAEAMLRNGLDSHKITLLPHGIPLPTSVPDFPPIIDGRIKFFYVGRICYVKGLHILLQAFSHLRNSNIELHLIGGSGNKTEKRYETALKKRFASDQRIVWHGKVAPDKVFDVIGSFHVAVSVPIYMEIFGLNIAEALAMGKPVLATRCGGAEMQIKNGVNGWLVEPNDVGALAKKLDDIASNFMNYEPMLSAQRVISISQHCNALMQIYEEVAH
ncbi:glycosyltransferase [Alistipes sp. An31A]|uniref:glycosyltransferase family 4 protein n=1 Tax=Alistipes sp. An31A TaxID=1965631 RepID=UPI000B3993F1|nr:glycosyltransferase family 4 protein [Alistipes sp. An31A]OUO23512.1 glycosyltransferase [Alistipes sp. An31A]